jgi:hypothetical protein
MSSSRLLFEQLVNEAIIGVFSSLGPSCKQAVYDCMEKKYRLKKSDFAEHLTEFSEALQQMFGHAAGLLEIQIMKGLYRKAPEFKYWAQGALTFPDYVNALSRFISTY